MRTAKRFFSVLLFFVVLCSSIGIADIFNLNFYSGNITKVYAATAITANPTMTLTHGLINPTPVVSTNNIPENGAFLTWDISRGFGKYTLSYPIQTGRTVEFVFEKLGDYADVTYTVLDSLNNPAIIDARTYRIHTNRDANGGQRFVDYLTYYNDQMAGNDPLYAVNNNVPPSFRVSADRGFSFKYGDQTIHFRWDESTKSLLYATDGIAAGNVYDFTLTDPDGLTSKASVFNGFSLDDMVVTPTANSGKTVNEIIDQTISGTDNPGSDEVGLNIELALPKVWNGTAFDFVPPSQGASIPGLRTVIQLNNQDAAKGLQIIIDDISANPLTYSLSPPSAAGITITRTPQDSLEIKLSGLPAGQIYRNSVITASQISGTEIINTRPTNVPLGTFFTFPRFSIEPQGENYFVILEPYAGYPGYYKLMENASKPINPKDPTRIPDDSVIIESSGTEQLIYLPVSATPEAGRSAYYQIFFSPMRPFEQSILAGDYIYSQILHYKAQLGTVEIGIPAFYEVVSQNLVMPVGDMTGDTGELDMWFRWDLGSTTVINTLLDAAIAAGKSSLELDYLIATGLTPETSRTDTLATVRLNITRNAAGDLVAVYSDPDGKNRVLNTEPAVLKSERNASTNNIRYEGLVHLQLTAGRNNAAISIIPDLYYPNIYFSTIRPIARNGDQLNVSPSERDSFTLDYFSMLDVPPPQNLNLSGEPKDDGSFDISWDVSGSKLREYMNMASNIPSDRAKFGMNLYISSNEIFMRDEFYKYEYPQRIGNSVGFGSGYASFTMGDTLYFSAVGSNPAMRASDGNSYADPRAALRDGKTVRITDIPITDAERDAIMLDGSSLSRFYTLDGLDKNQKYYIYVDFTVNHDVTDPSAKDKASMTSNLIGVTTKGDKEIPTGEDKIPVAPKLTVTNIDLGEATIQWPEIPATSAGETVEYQIIRVTDKQMEDKYLDTSEAYENYWNNYLSGLTKLGLQTSGSNRLVYDGTNFVPNDSLQCFYDASTGTRILTDKTLAPNKLYFYYVRTVKTFTTPDGTTVNYSTWAHISVTTDPVKSPMNLRVELARTDYAPKTEVIISFDAPIPDLSNLGPIYNLQYQLKAEGQDWSDPVTMSPDILRESATAAPLEGYYHFTYKIVGLTASTSYMVRVRMIDQTDGSLYTNAVQFRTEFDQGDYTEEQDIDDWLNYLEKQLQELLDDHFWATTDTTGIFESLYRPSMWSDMIAQSTDSTILLPQTSAGNISYFIPSSALTASSDVNKGFRIVHNGSEIIIAPNSIDRNQNQAMADIIRKMNQNEISDYFLRISLTWADQYERIDGNEAVGKTVDVRLELVGTKMLIRDWDAQVLRDCKVFIDNFLKDPKILEDLRARRRSGSTDEALVRHVDDLVKQARERFLSQIASSYGNIVTVSYAIDSLQRPISVIARGIDPAYTVRAYRRQGTQWIGVDLSPYGDDYVIYTTQPGLFAFTGSLLNIPGINEMQNAGELTGIISKYGLDDFLGRGGFNPEDDASRLMAAGCIARIMGAPKDADPYDWLSKNKKITLSSRNSNAGVTAQEAAYLAAMLYEAKSGINLASMQVRNYNAVAQMQGLDEKYKLYIRAANELGIIDANDFSPGSVISIKRVLQMIDAVDTMLKF